MSALRAVKTLFSLFTVLPVNADSNDVYELSRKFWLLPLIGAFFGFIAGSMLLILNNVFPPLVSSTIVLATLHGTNRFLHIDGLIDFGDGVITVGSKDDKIRAMKDVRAGTGGIIHAILFTLLVVTSLSSLPFYLLFLAPFAAEVLSRNSMVTCAAIGKPRDEGIGSIFVKNTKYKSLILSTILSTALIYTAGYLTGIFNIFSNVEFVIIFLLLIFSSCLAGIVMAEIAMKNFECVTGDVLGATNEIARSVILLVILVVVECLKLMQL